MRTRRYQRGVQRRKVSLLATMRAALARHGKKYFVVYVPAFMPLVLFFLANCITLLTLVLIKSGFVPPGPILHRTVLTWAVYGILPLLFCSYLGFFAVARPASRILAHRFGDWSARQFNLAVGGIYGAAMGIVLFLLFEPGTVARALFLLIVALATGQGNWFFYRILTTESAPDAVDRSLDADASRE